MTIEENVAVQFVYGVQADINTVATAGGTSQIMRRLPSGGLNGSAQRERNPEVRTDQQAGDPLDGPRSCGGSLDMPLATVANDDFFAAVMRNTWAAPIALAEADFTSLTIAGGVVTLGGGNPYTLGLRIGRVYDLTLMSVAGNNTRIRITAMTSTTFTAVKLSDGSALADNATDSDCAITEVGKSLIQGLDKTAFTVEQRYPNVDGSEVFKHCRLGGMQVRLPPAGACTVSFPTMGLDWENVSGGSSPYFTSPTAASETPVLEMAGGEVTLNGQSYSVSSLDLSLNVPLSPNGPLVGRETGTEIHHGESMLTGNVSFFLESMAQLDLFRSGTYIDVIAHATEAGGSFYDFIAQRVKIMSMQKPIPADGGVLLQCAFQASKKVAGSGYAGTTLTIQRSNS